MINLPLHLLLIIARGLAAFCSVHRSGCFRFAFLASQFCVWPAAVLQSCEGMKPPELVSVRPSTPLREVLALLAQHRLHRLHVIDERQRPVGIVTITDLLRCIVGCNELLEALGPVSPAAPRKTHCMLRDCVGVIQQTRHKFPVHPACRLNTHTCCFSAT